MAPTVDLWTPPEGMYSSVVAQWRRFYSHTMDVYGITPAQYRLLYIAQKGRCWICRTAKGVHPDDPKGGGSRRLGVDHDHVTGRVRGLLCTGGDRTCNRVIGWLNATQLERAARYLRGVQPAPKVLQAIEYQIGSAEADGVTLTDAEIEKLAVTLLWGSDTAPNSKTACCGHGYVWGSRWHDCNQAPSSTGSSAGLR